MSMRSKTCLLYVVSKIKKTLYLCVFMINLFALGSVDAMAGIWTTIDVPGAYGAKPTQAYGIDGSNIVGYYWDGGAVGCYFNDFSRYVTAINCTFVGNSARYGGAVYSYGRGNTVSLQNSILWDNTASGGDGYEVYCYNPSCYPSYNNYIKLYYCYIQSHGGDWKYDDPGNCAIVSLEGDKNTVTATDPDFPPDTDPDGADNEWATSDDGFALSSTSDCIDEGYNSYTYTPDPFYLDITGADRTVGTVDIGAYEYDPG